MLIKTQLLYNCYPFFTAVKLLITSFFFYTSNSINEYDLLIITIKTIISYYCLVIIYLLILRLTAVSFL